MQVSNVLLEDSFRYTDENTSMEVRSQQIMDLAEIDYYCKYINEAIIINDAVWEIEVEKGVTLIDWLYSSQNKGSHDDKAMLIQILTKQKKMEKCEDAQIIDISLGKWRNAACNKKQYVEKRRDILTGIKKVQEYYDFMRSCFINCYFSDDMLQEMKYIEDFQDNTGEITKALSVLNDEAIELYLKYKNNLDEAMRELSCKLKRECSLDPGHKSKLKFMFTYENLDHNEQQMLSRLIACEPHIKLIRPDSNLRIYFKWIDENIANGKKVLIGRVGRHPYKK